MKPKLIDDDDSRDHFRLSWYFPNEGEIGGSVGDGSTGYSKFTEAEIAAIPDLDTRECAVAYRAAVTAQGTQRDGFGFFWSTRAQAQAALRIVKLALSAAPERPLPEWAKQAIAAGWKAPKGWKP